MAAAKSRSPRSSTPRARAKSTAAVEASAVEAVAVEAAAEPMAVALPAIEVDAAPAVRPDPAAIRARAHAIFLAEGGRAFDNWLRAERELAQAAR